MCAARLRALGISDIIPSMGFFRNIYRFNISRFSEPDQRAVRLGNLLGLLGITTTSFYSIFYYLILHSIKAALINEIFAFGYLFYFYFISKCRILPAVLSLAFNYMGNMFIIVVFFTSNRSGFHYYYFLVGPSIYFFLRDISRKFIVAITSLAFILFVICESLGSRYSELILSDSQFHFLYFSTISIAFILLVVIVHTFVEEIDTRQLHLEQSANDLAVADDELTKKIKERKQAEAALKEERNRLQKALVEIQTLSGMLPICSSCKKIRDDQGYWNQLESYIMDHSQAQFSHSLCPKCAKALYAGFMKKEDSK
jgi:hypothetical protein